jgi:hypothetical protein
VVGAELPLELPGVIVEAGAKPLTLLCGEGTTTGSAFAVTVSRVEGVGETETGVFIGAGAATVTTLVIAGLGFEDLFSPTVLTAETFFTGVNLGADTVVWGNAAHMIMDPPAKNGTNDFKADDDESLLNTNLIFLCLKMPI